MITLLTILGWMAWGGGILLFFQAILIIFGFDGTDTDIDMSTDIDADLDTDLDADTDTDSAARGGGVKLFSLLGMSAFIAIFGLVGRYCIITLSLHWSIALLIATVIALFVMYLVGWIFYKFKKMETNGTTKIKNAVNCTGTVYLPFKNDEIGTVHVDVNGIMREYDAKASNGEVFNVGDSVKVIKSQGNFVTVTKNN
jgi:membrane protein implicated in regulation of membrane protease activity